MKFVFLREEFHFNELIPSKGILDIRNHFASMQFPHYLKTCIDYPHDSKYSHSVYLVSFTLSILRNNDFTRKIIS